MQLTMLNGMNIIARAISPLTRHVNVTRFIIICDYATVWRYFDTLHTPSSDQVENHFFESK